MITFDEVLALAAPPPDRRLPYGPDPHQFGELRLPGGSGPHPVVVLVHGGCWQAAYDITHSRPMAAALTRAGVAVWSIEYRRLGNPGGGWPGTFQDVGAAADALQTLTVRDRLDLSRVVVVGHSAGGHLALWLASRTTDRTGPAPAPSPLRVAGVVGLAAIADLSGYGAGPGNCNRSVYALVGGPPSEHAERYAQVDPMRRLPLPQPIRLIHGVDDVIVDADQPRRYQEAARAAGAADVQVLAVPGGHFDVIAPFSPAWPAVVAAVRDLTAL